MAQKKSIAFIHEIKELTEQTKALEHEIVNIQEEIRKLMTTTLKTAINLDEEKININDLLCKDRSNFSSIQRSCQRAKTINKPIKVCKNSGDKSKNTSIMMEELQHKHLDKAPPVYIVIGNNCNLCDNPMNVNRSMSTMSCSNCGLYHSYIESSKMSLKYNEDIEYSNFSYKRSNHMSEIINSFQAKETTPIPDKILNQVMNKIYERRIVKPELITNSLIRSVLKECGLRRYYENSTAIRCLITGQEPPRLKPNEEQCLKLMFEKANQSFMKHQPDTRKNFLSYHYVCFKMLEIMRLDKFLPYFHLLKGKEKLFQQDEIWSKICEDNNWPYNPSV